MDQKSKQTINRKVKKFVWLTKGIILVLAVLYGVWLYKKRYIDTQIVDVPMREIN